MAVGNRQTLAAIANIVFDKIKKENIL
jgi:hypothetical protein